MKCPGLLIPSFLEKSLVAGLEPGRGEGRHLRRMAVERYTAIPRLSIVHTLEATAIPVFVSFRSICRKKSSPGVEPGILRL